MSRDEIDFITERMLEDYDPKLLTEPQAIDIDAVAQNYLGAHQSFEYLSHCGIYLGMTVFNDTNRVEIFDPVLQQADYTSAKANTIIIDRTLLEQDQEHRYRFTMGHECGHLGLGHGAAEAARGKGVRCRVNGSRARGRDPRFWRDEDWMEWQADNFASCILLPRKAIGKLKAMIDDGFDYEGSHGLPSLVGAVPVVFNVSNEAAMIRLKQLGFVKDRFDLADLET